MKIAFIALFGLLGVFTRYFIGSTPEKTFWINVAGSFLIGVIYVVGIERSAIPEELRVGIMVGFLGGFTTFSSYCLDALKLFEEAKFGVAILYFGLSPFLGLTSAFAGVLLTRFVVRTLT